MTAVDRAPANFRFLTADQWGMTWTNPARTEKLNDPEAYVHMTGGGRMSTDAVQAFRALNRWAQEGKNYSALDYDILVHRDVVSGLMTIGAGRGEWMSAATKDRNELGEAVCLFGQFHPGERGAEQPHPDELEAIAFAILWGIEKGWIARDAVILGHRDNPAHPGATACPGDFLYAHLPTIRRRVGELLAPPPTEDDMSKVNAVFIRMKGTADHWVCFPVSGDTKARLDPDEPTPIVVDGDRAEFARRAGYPLTPMPGE